MLKIYYVFALLVSATLLVSNSANPPDGRSGAPGDGLCSDCHTLDGGLQDGSITLTGFPTTIQPSTAYFLTITNSNPNGLAGIAGFQMTILNSANQKAGVMSNAGPFSHIDPSGPREYWEHFPAQGYPGNNMVPWTVTWTSPAGPANTTITYYAAGNVANDNGQNNGDLIVTMVGSGTLNGGTLPLEIDIVASTNVNCNGGNTGSATAGATGGVMPYTYNWSNGQNGATAINLTAGTYTVTVTDNNGSTASTPVTITQPTAIVFQTPVISHVTCFGGNNGSIQANATGGVPPYSYDWSNGATTSLITGLIAGSYTVTVTDDNNCSKTATYIVNQPSQIVINLVSLTHESCSGEEDGAITISVTGGATPYFAEWSNGFIGATITDLAPDTYSVTVTDNNNCTKTASYTINPGGIVDVSLQQIQHVTCNGGNNGAITVTVSGGTSPYTFEWSNGGNNATITNLIAGNYILTVTDNNGCVVVEAYVVNEPDPIIVGINSSGQNLCAGDSLVNLTASASGDNPPFAGSWSNGVSGLANPGLPAGIYTVTITDDVGCTATSSATVTEPSILTVTVVTTDETNSGAMDGTANATPAGGTADYTFLWSTGAVTNSIAGLAPGTYTVTVTDNNGCTVTGSGQVDEFGCTVDVALGTDLLICEEDTGLLLPSVIGGSGTLSFLWSDGSTGDSLLVSAGGEYCLTVTDMANCQDVDCIIVTEDDFPEITCPVINESAPGMNDGAIQCNGVPGIVSYLWSNGATTPDIVGLSPGEYCVTMTNSAGCVGIQCIIVQPGNCQLSITSIITNVACAGDPSGSVFVTVENATPPVNYLWSNGDTDANAENLVAGVYSLTLSDAGGCGEILSFTITQPEPMVITVDSVANVTDSGPGLIFITASGGVLPYSFLWTDPSGDQFPGEDLNNLVEVGYYAVLLTDANGCTVTVDSILVDQDVAVRPDPLFSTIKVYPVPARDVLIMDMENQVTEAWITGIDGRVYKHITNPVSNKIHVEDLQPGWYFIRMTDGRSWFAARMVK